MEEKRSQSEFNMALSYLNRLNGLFYVCDDAAINLDAYTWFHSLMAIARELSTEMKDKEIEEMEKNIAELNPLVLRSMTNTRRTGKVELQPELYQKLHKFELKLRKIMKDAGLQMKMTEPIVDALR